MTVTARRTRAEVEREVPTSKRRWSPFLVLSTAPGEPHRVRATFTIPQLRPGPRSTAIARQGVRSDTGVIPSVSSTTSL